MNTEPRTSTANGSAMISATWPMALSTWAPRARHSAALAGAAFRSFWRHFRRQSFCTSRLSRSSRTATHAKLKSSRPKTVFLIEGDDRVGAMASTLSRLGAAGINVIAVSAVRTGMGRYGGLLWVKPKDVAKAAETLGA